MSNNIIVCGDLHFTSRKPFFYMQQDFIKWFVEQDFNNNLNYCLFVGDMYDLEEPDTETNLMMFDFISKLKFKKIFVVCGNHPYSKEKNIYSEEFLNVFNNVLVITKPEIINIDSYKILALPYIYDFSYDTTKTMKQLYENLPEQFSKEEYDIVTGHFSDVQMFNDGINVDYIKAKKRIFGHIHIHQENDNFVGSPYILRYDERNKVSRLVSISLETNEFRDIKIPTFIEYNKAIYPDDLPDTDFLYTIWDIKNAPSREIVRQFYEQKYGKKIYFRDIEKTKLIEALNNENEQIFNLNTIFETFCKETKVNTVIESKLKPIIVNEKGAV